MVGRAAYAHPLRWQTIDAVIYGDEPSQVLASDVVLGLIPTLRSTWSGEDASGTCADTWCSSSKGYAVPGIGVAISASEHSVVMPISMSWKKPAVNSRTPASRSERAQPSAPP